MAGQSHERTPSPSNAVNAIAGIFARGPNEPLDIFTTSAVALLICTMGRAPEVLQLPADCELQERTKDGAMRYGLHSVKGLSIEPNILWYPTILAPVAKEAIRRIRALTDEARDLARWLERSSTRFYRHRRCPEVGDGVSLTAKQAAAAVGVNTMAALGLSPSDGAYTLNSLWKTVREQQPTGFPWINKQIGLKYSNALFCMTKNLLREQRSTSPVVLWAPDIDTLADDLSPRKGTKAHATIFDRQGYRFPEGQPLTLSLHSLRSWLAKIIEQGDVPYDVIAKWPASKDRAV
jgi:hypothetical protein